MYLFDLLLRVNAILNSIILLLGAKLILNVPDIVQWHSFRLLGNGSLNIAFVHSI